MPILGGQKLTTVGNADRSDHPDRAGHTHDITGTLLHVARGDSDPRQVVEGESFGAPVPGQWPGGAPSSQAGQDAGNRYGCLIVGGFWLGMFALLWVPPLFALAWAMIGIALVARPEVIVRRLNSGSTASTRLGLVRLLTAPWRSPLAVRGFGVLILAIVAVAVLAETARS